MTDTDVALVQSLYAAFERGDLAAIHSHLAPDLVVEQLQELPWGGRYHGPDGFFEFIGKLSAAVDSQVESEAIFSAGDAVVQVGHTVGKVRGSETTFRVREVHILKLRDHQLVHYQAFVDGPAMLRALNGESAVSAGSAR